VKQWSQKAGRIARFDRQFTCHAAPASRLAPEQHWSVAQPPLHVRAMVLTRDALFVAGPPDVLDEDAAYQRPNDSQVRAAIAEQDAAYAGEHGALLMGLSKDAGKVVCRIGLPAVPVWDGMVAARGRLFVSARDGTIRCLGAD
jgi:hypothetical protein